MGEENRGEEHKKRKSDANANAMLEQVLVSVQEAVHLH